MSESMTESPISAEDRELLEQMEVEACEIAKWQAELDNKKKGYRPEWDTIDCPICKNRMYITVANGPELISVDCSSVRLRSVPVTSPFLGC